MSEPTDRSEVARRIAKRYGFFVWNTGQWYLANDNGDRCDFPNDKRDALISSEVTKYCRAGQPGGRRK